MATISNPDWRNIGIQLRNIYHPQRYFTHQAFLRDHFLQPVVPYNESFLGCKNFNILIISKPWIWTPELEAMIEEAKRIIIRNFKKWPNYGVDIYLDYILATRASRNRDNTGYISKLDALEPHIITLCDDMRLYNFTYRGKLQEGDHFTFKEDCDVFYNLRETDN